MAENDKKGGKPQAAAGKAKAAKAAAPVAAAPAKSPATPNAQAL
mgnify:CR=1 FL=1